MPCVRIYQAKTKVMSNLYHMVGNGWETLIVAPTSKWIGLRGNLQENPSISWENRWFPVDFPLNQSIELLIL
jgi:hypothetical protein